MHDGRGTARQVIEDRCLGQTTCMFTVTADLFGSDPCPSIETPKRLAAILECGDSLTADAEPVPEVIVRSAHYGWKFIFIVVFLFAVYLTLGVVYNVRRTMCHVLGRPRPTHTCKTGLPCLSA
jgi:hypothetical protein